MNETRPRVLVVDDLPDSADSMADLLALWGYGAEAHYSGASALASVRLRQPVAVLFEVGLSGMDGFAFAARLRSLPGCGRTALVAISGHTDETCRVRCCEMAISHYLFKPVAPNRLKTLLDRIVVESQALPGTGLPIRTVGMRHLAVCSRESCDFVRKAGASCAKQSDPADLLESIRSEPANEFQIAAKPAW